MTQTLAIVPADLVPFLVSGGLGMMIGLERERHAQSRAGVRTHALLALSGTVLALLEAPAGGHWLLAAAVLAVAGMMIGAYLQRPDPEDPGTTSVMAAVFTLLLGAYVPQGGPALATVLGLTVTALLYFKAELRGLAAQITRTDWLSILQFATVVVVVLPLLPDTGYGPFNAVNPRQIWWMVVLISGVSLVGYFALRLLGAQYGSLVLGVSGGLVSSTATTLIFARHARKDDAMTSTATVVILIANLVMLVRLALFGAVVAPAILPQLAPPLALAFVCGAGVVLLRMRAHGRTPAAATPEIRNPAEMRVAIGFATMYALVLLASAWLMHHVGTSGLYAVALASGLTDVDAIALSSLRLFSVGTLPADAAVTAVGLAALANLGFKAALAAMVGGRGLARPVLLGMALVAVGLGAGLLVF